MRFKWFFLFFLLSVLSAAGQSNFSISGTVSDSETGETLPGATIRVKETGKVTVTNLYGFYSLTLPQGSYTIEYLFVGFDNQVRKVDLTDSQKINVAMGEVINEIEEVVITYEKVDKNVAEVEMSTTEIKIDEIKKMPALLGEVDVIKTIQLLPGVTTVGEGASGFNVRGGSIDQNLILLDEATVYSSSHLFGFFSVFNSDVVKDVKLYKGGIPARYGGRISSVLDVRQKEGNMKELHGSGGVGVVSSRLTLEGPIVKDKASFIVAGRRSYADLFLKLSPDEAISSNVAFFYDLNTKVNYKLNDNNRLFLSGYWGRDVFKFGDVFGFDWGNQTGTLRWNHIFGDKLFGNFSGIISNYDYAFGGDNFFIWSSQIGNYNFKADFDYYLNDKHKLEFGTQNVLYRFAPAKLEPKGAFVDIFQAAELQQENAYEPALFVSDEFTVNSKLTVSAGLRYSAFVNYGPSERYLYEEGVTKTDKTIIDTVNYSNNEVIQSYAGLEPRIGIKYSVDSASSIKLNYMRTRQNVHLISNTTNGLPTDIWKPADNYVKPQIGDQVALGYFRNFLNNQIEGSVEVYYKDIQNLLDYKDAAELFFGSGLEPNGNIETELLQGKGRAYGLELLVRKTKGKFIGWLGYTLSKTERLIEGDYQEETINEGEWYPSAYDKRHDLTLFASYELNKQLNFGMNFTYGTGRALTFPDSKYVVEGIVIPNYIERNSGRAPDYHRLDFSITYDPKSKKDKAKELAQNTESEELVEKKRKTNFLWDGSWTLSVYNVYSRDNSFSLLFQEDPANANNTVVKNLTILPIVVPAITYNFNF